MLTRAGHARHRHQQGVAAVELALLLPVLLFLIYGTAEFGRALHERTLLTRAVRDGAQYLARHAFVAGAVAPTSGQIGVAKHLVVYGSPVAGAEPLLPGLSLADVVIEMETVPPSLIASHVRVTASHDFQPAFGGVIPSFDLAGGDPAAPGGYTASVRMRGIGP